ncbi:hypothetical protein BOX15_Mlig024652g1 [Macrostomum lignano]|uniref:DUF4471 domain-containing protein n=2 Tax=Macrostomum lignano TaxID=282301 RepID=A0A1I8HUC1_9PLAT|nr:hypothetical protein BOX15_Mlig016493g1 [Macrostomum lignano]PAA63586.1 hypothetical protein BOX15_Mlig024652g1 [Macrostomum lignano]
MTEPLESAPLGSPPRELTFVKASSPPFIQKINGEDYDVISIAVDIPGFGRPTDTFVFLGEGNFTFSNAFASRRESWQGVVPTTFDASEQSLKKTAKDWAGTLEANVKNATKEDMKNEMKYWMKTKPPQQRHLDATNLGDRAGLSSRLGIPKDSTITLWFQGPWSEGFPGGQINFIKAFMHSGAAVQKHGELLLLGLCIDEGKNSRADDAPAPYVHYYGKLQSAGSDYYDCVGADLQFVGEMIRRGYRHEAAAAGHCADKFATLLFRRNSQAFIKEAAQPEKPASS